MFFILALLALVFFGSRYSHLFYLAGLPWTDMRSLDDRIYVDPELGYQRSRQLLDAWRMAKSRISQRFGLSAANPVLVVTMHADRAERFGLAGDSGIAFALPWQHYIVVRWQDGFVDLLAHELMHAQVRDITGYWRYLLQVPTWLDEGIAMQVDDREVYRVNPQTVAPGEIARVRRLTRARQFWSNDAAQNLRNYRAAKAAVARLLDDRSGNVARIIALQLGDKG